MEEQYPRKTCPNYRMHCAEKGAWKFSFRQKHCLTAAASLAWNFCGFYQSFNLIKHNQWTGYAFYRWFLLLWEKNFFNKIESNAVDGSQFSLIFYISCFTQGEWPDALKTSFYDLLFINFSLENLNETSWKNTA